MKGIAGRFGIPQLLLFIELCIVFFFSLRPAVDPDYGWHIANGHHVRDGLTLGGRDIYSWTASGLWVAHEWMTEWGMSAIHDAFGPAGNSIVAAMIGVVIYALVARLLLKSGIGWAATLIALPICFFGAVRSIAVRPMMLELLYLAALITWINSFVRREVTRGVFLSVVAFGGVIWANTHGSFPLLVVVLGISAVELMFWKDSRWRDLVIAAAIAPLSFALNPWGLDLYQFAVQSIQSDPTLAYIQEWQRPRLLDAQSIPLMLQLILAAIGVAVTIMSKDRPDSSNEGVVRAPAFAVLALRSGRHVALLGIAGAGEIGRGVSALISRHRDSVQTKHDEDAQASISKSLINAVAAVAVALAIAIAGWKQVSPSAQDRAVARRYPTGLMNVLESEYTTRDRLLNEYQWGGYLIGRGKVRVFIDGRSELYGDKQLERYASIVHLTPNWNHIVDSLGITLALMPTKAPLSAALARARWQTVASDSVGILFRRPER